MFIMPPRTTSITISELCIRYTKQGDIDSIKDLLVYENYDNFIDIPDNSGNTAFMYACKYGFIEIVKLLLDYYPREDAVDNRGRTALMMACYNGYVDIVKEMLKIDDFVNTVNMTDSENTTALIYASLEGHVQIVDVLLNIKIIDTSICDTFNCNALFYASLIGHKTITKRLKNYFRKDIKTIPLPEDIIYNVVDFCY